jgi:hypothetical protein
MKSRVVEDEDIDGDGDESQTEQPAAEETSVPLDKMAGVNGGDEGRRLTAFWRDQIDQVDEEQKRWVIRGKRIEKRYRDERQDRTDDLGNNRRYSSLWSNVQILYPSLYAKEPMPIVERRFRDKDPTGRAAASMLERTLRNEQDIAGIDDSIGQAVMDYLLPGRGTAWVRYESELG